MDERVILYLPRKPFSPEEEKERARDLRGPRAGFIVTVVRVAGTRSWSAAYSGPGGRVELGYGTLRVALEAAGRYYARGLIGTKVEVLVTRNEVEEARAVLPELREWTATDEAEQDARP